VNGLRRMHARPWTLAALTILFVAGHVILFRFLRNAHVARAAVPGAVLLGLVLLMIAKHLGLLAGLFALFRRRSRS
jgi:hypothetical protein